MNKQKRRGKRGLRQKRQHEQRPRIKVEQSGVAANAEGGLEKRGPCLFGLGSGEPWKVQREALTKRDTGRFFCLFYFFLRQDLTLYHRLALST